MPNSARSASALLAFVSVLAAYFLTVASCMKCTATRKPPTRITARATPTLRMYLALANIDLTSLVRLPIRIRSRIRTQVLVYQMRNFSDFSSSLTIIRRKCVTTMASSSPATPPIIGPRIRPPTSAYRLKSVMPMMGIDARVSSMPDRCAWPQTPTWYSTGAIARLKPLPMPRDRMNSPMWTFTTSTSTTSTVCKPDQPGIMPVQNPSSTVRKINGGATFPRNTANNLLTDPGSSIVHLSDETPNPTSFRMRRLYRSGGGVQGEV